MVQSIIRTPTRTKTSSFHGNQMDFKFPSSESLSSNEFDVNHLNNHHLSKDLTPNVKNLDVNTGNHDSDANSQILSDYTSFSNPNSSTGYYSFANISDNTTSRAGEPNSNRYGYSMADSHPNNEYRSTLAPERVATELSMFDTDLDKKSPILLQNEIDDTQKRSDTINQLLHTDSQTIPNVENISFRIESASSSRQSSKTVIKRSNRATLTRVPTITRITSSATTNFRSGSEGSSLSLNKDKISHSGLKRSNAIRCKGGLLHYFTTIGTKFKNQLHRLRVIIRRKLFSYKGQKRISRSGSARNNLNKSTNPSSIKNIPVTSHLKRTQCYASTLQKSMSYKSLEPVLASKYSDKIPETPRAMTNISEHEKNIGNKITSSIRRTPSSIRRAASVFTTSSVPSNIFTENSINKRHPEDRNFSNTSLNRTNSSNSKTKIVRSSGLGSLNTILREPSIVVKNTVIPLSMKHYSIKEEDEERETDNNQNEKLDKDEYVIDTQAMHPLSIIESYGSQSTNTTVESSLLNNTEYISLHKEKEHSSEDDDIEKQGSTQLESVFNQYFTQVISQRIMMRLQIAKFHETGKLVDETTKDNKYLDAIVTLLSEQESTKSGSQLFEKDHIYSSPNTSETDSSDYENNEEAINEVQSKSHSTHNSNIINISFQSPFGNVNTSQSNRSVLSFQTRAVKRSLTLPIGIKV